MPRLIGSPQQEAIWDAIVNRKSNIVVKAGAGTGKTTVIVEGAKRLPSSQKIAVVCFNKPIATHLQSLVPRHVLACTSHSLGGQAVSRQTNRSIKDMLDFDKVPKMIPAQASPLVRSAVIRLVGLVKATLSPTDNDHLTALAIEYSIELETSSKVVFNLVRMCLEKSKDATTIDFNDMLWLPVVWALPMEKFDMMFVDEGQDLNRCQQELVMMSARRVCLVGDENQSIYAFRAADFESMERMEIVLEGQPAGVEVLPLTVTRRCLPAIVELANSIVPELECPPLVWQSYLDWKKSKPAPDAVIPPEYGLVVRNSKREYMRGDLVLCRTNAPLVQEAYSLIRDNMPVKIQGKDIGLDLKNQVKRILPFGPVDNLLVLLNEWRTKQTLRLSSDPSKLLTNEVKLQALQDKCECIEALCEGMDTVQQVLDRIDLIFADVKDGDYRNFVLFSSIHKAKGMESEVVFILHPELMPHPMAKTPQDQEQEKHLQYVAWTRAKRELHFRPASARPQVPDRT